METGGLWGVWLREKKTTTKHKFQVQRVTVSPGTEQGVQCPPLASICEITGICTHTHVHARV